MHMVSFVRADPRLLRGRHGDGESNDTALVLL